ncbi:MAG: hypothetical protein R3F14_05480 [Polyangiaceae bacterium]
MSREASCGLPLHERAAGTWSFSARAWSSPMVKATAMRRRSSWES